MHLNHTTSTHNAKADRAKADRPKADGAKTNAVRPQWAGQRKGGPLGPLTLVWDDVGVVELRFGPLRERPEGVKKARIPGWLQHPLDAYFDGDGRALLTVPLAVVGTPFQERVWRELRQIPFGSVRSYGAVAIALGNPRAMRAVGMANRANPVPILIPCHRVVQTGLKLGGYRGGLDRKRFLLQHESVPVVGDQVLPGQLPLPPKS